MHSKPTKRILYHCPEALYPKLQAMSQASGKSVTLTITAAIESAWQKYCQEVESNFTRENEEGYDNGK